jgi:hypothetical protein
MIIDEIIGPLLNEAEAFQACHCEERQRRGNLAFQPRIAASDGFALLLAMTWTKGFRFGPIQ